MFVVLDCVELNIECCSLRGEQTTQVAQTYTIFKRTFNNIV